MGVKTKYSSFIRRASRILCNPPLALDVEMDYIIVMDQGEIVETGTHEQLLKAKGTYTQLIQAQMHGTEEQDG